MLSKLIIILMCFVMSKGFAESGEKPAEGHGGGGAESGAPPAQGPQKLPEWSDMINKIAALNAKIKQKEEVIKKLIMDKHHATGEHSKELVENLIEEHKELNTMKEQYEKQRMILKYRFPEKLLKEGRQYDRKKIMTLQETEKQVGLDGKLDQSLKKVRNKYGTDPKKDSDKVESVPPSKESDADSNYDQSKPILIQK